MKKVLLTVLILFFSSSSVIYAHSGRTDANGGHNCSEKSQAKGLCSGYHYHNGGSSSSESSSSGSSSQSTRNNDKNCSDFGNYDEVIAYWNANGYSATNDPENLDGWGNGVVDDGIPCEAPSGYDKTKINNSPEQVQFNQDQQDNTEGQKSGYAQGYKDGYQEATSNTVSAEGSEAYKEGYTTGYNKGFQEGTEKIGAEKIQANSEGYTLGTKQDELLVPQAYASNESLKLSFEEGFNKAVNERIEAKKQEMNQLGYNDGKNDVLSTPQDIEEIYVKAYQEGYKKAQKDLEEEYNNQGYEAAFTMLKYKEPSFPNPKFKEWYKEGFNSNKVIEKIEKAGYVLGESGEDYKLPTEYEKGEEIFKHYYDLGKVEYEAQKRTVQTSVATGAGLMVVGWLGRRFYVAKKMIS